MLRSGDGDGGARPSATSGRAGQQMQAALPGCHVIRLQVTSILNPVELSLGYPPGLLEGM